MYGKDYRYADSRLAGTIVRLKKDGEPIFIHNVSHDDGRCEAGTLNGEMLHDIYLDDLDVTPVPLGFVNFKSAAIYLTRIPKRGDYRQGLRQHNSAVIYPNFVKYPPNNVIANTIKGKFPSLSAARRNSSKAEGTSCAWHKHWAVKNGKEILYKGFGKVGSFTEPSSNQFSLDKGYEYLFEYLMEVTNDNNI